eukprot:6212707-Pleurochrysis_carterae.AAC.5
MPEAELRSYRLAIMHSLFQLGSIARPQMHIIAANQYTPCCMVISFSKSPHNKCSMTSSLDAMKREKRKAENASRVRPDMSCGEHPRTLLTSYYTIDTESHLMKRIVLSCSANVHAQRTGKSKANHNSWGREARVAVVPSGQDTAARDDRRLYLAAVLNLAAVLSLASLKAATSLSRSAEITLTL